MNNKTEKPSNLRTNVLPKDGYLLAVDGKLKSRYATSEEANAAAMTLKQNFPVLQVAVFDAATRSYSPVALPEEE